MYNETRGLVNITVSHLKYSRGKGSPMEINDVLSLMFERANATQVFWNFYVVITTAILAFLAAMKVHQKPLLLSAVLSLAFVTFAWSNYSGINNVRMQRVSIAKLATSMNKEKSVNIQGVIDSSIPRSQPLLATFHFVADLLVIFLIWLIPVFKYRQSHKELV